MSWTFQQSQYNWTYPGTSSGQTLTFANPCTPGSLLVGTLTTLNSNSQTGVALSDNVNGNWTPITTANGGYGEVSAWYIVNSSSAELVCQWGSLAAEYPGYQVAEFTGNASSSPLDASASGGGVDTLSVNVNNANELVIGWCCPSSGGSMENGAGWTSTDPGDSSGGPMIYATSSGPTASPLFTGSGGIVAASFKPSGGGPSYTAHLMTLLGVGQ